VAVPQVGEFTAAGLAPPHEAAIGPGTRSDRPLHRVAGAGVLEAQLRS
jgi:hypothetical protein